MISIDKKQASFTDEILPINKSEQKPHVRFASNSDYVQQCREAEEKKKAAREAAEKLEISHGYEEIKDLFTQQSKPIRDSYGRRWIKCERCGEIKLSNYFGSYGGAGHVNLGVCNECSNGRG